MRDNGLETEGKWSRKLKDTWPVPDLPVGQGGKFSLEENFFLYRGIDRGVGHKIRNTQTVRFNPTLGLERKCMDWDFPEPGPNLVPLGNKFTK